MLLKCLLVLVVLILLGGCWLMWIRSCVPPREWQDHQATFFAGVDRDGERLGIIDDGPTPCTRVDRPLQECITPSEEDVALELSEALAREEVARRKLPSNQEMLVQMRQDEVWRSLGE